MICPKCQTLIPQPALHCEACLQRLSLDAARASQVEYLRYVLKGKLNLHVRRRMKTALTGHLALFGLLKFAYCGENLTHGYPIKESPIYDRDLRSKLCPKCLAVFDEIAPKAKDAPLPAETATPEAARG